MKLEFRGKSCAAEYINNVTWSYAIFVLLKTLTYTNVVQYKEKVLLR